MNSIENHQKNIIDWIYKIKYLKTGNFIKDLKTTIVPFVGSSNQKFEEVK